MIRLLFKNVWKISYIKSTVNPLISISIRREFSSIDANQNELEKNAQTIQTNQPIQTVYFQNIWPVAEKEEFERDMIIVEDFISEAEEQSLIGEAEKSLKRMRYEYDHWDDAIHGYREMEKVDWLPENRILFDRVRQYAYVSDIMPHVHILDLAKDGIIKPHVDSSRYCGTTIAGLSLLSDCIMRLRRVDEKKYVQPKMGEDTVSSNTDNNRSKSNDVRPATEYNYFADALLKRRSLYVMKNTARYNFTHEVLANNAEFNGVAVEKGRRISIICRNQP